MGFYAGLDVHSKETVFEIQDSTGQVVKTGRFPTTASGIASLAGDLAEGSTVGLETGGMAFYVARQLQTNGSNPVVIDAYEVRIKAHRPRQKSDRRDAHEICDGLRRDIYRSLVHVPPIDIQQIRGLLSRRRYFVRHKTREINAAKHLLWSMGLGHLLPKTLTRLTAWEKLFTRLEEEPATKRLVEHHWAMWKCAEEQKVAIEKELDAYRQPYQDKLKRLQTILGVGPVVSLTLVTTLSDVTRFPSAKEVASYAGVVPSSYQSGKRDHHGHITKRGSAELRAMLCEAAHHANRPSNPFHPYFAKLCAKRGYKIAVTATAHRIYRLAPIFSRSRQAT